MGEKDKWLCVILECPVSEGKDLQGIYVTKDFVRQDVGQLIKMSKNEV